MSATTALADSMTLSDVVSQALGSHPEYQQSQELVGAAKEGVKQAKAGYLPKVDVSLGTGYERTENQSTVNRQVANPSRSDHADLNRQEASLSITQMLFDGFATSARVEMAKSDLDNQINFSKEIADKVALLATKAFYDVKRENTSLLIDEENLKMHQSYQSQIKRRVGSGKSNKADLEQVNSRVALATSQVIQRQEALELAKADFVRQVGVEADVLLDNEIDFSLVPATLQDAIDEAFAGNPRIKALEANLKASRSSIKEAKSAYMPKINLEVGATRNQNVDGVDKKDHDETAMVRMNYNLYNGGADKARHMAALSESQASLKALEDVRREISKDVKNAWYNYQLTTKRLAALASQVRSAKATKVAYKSQFDVGQRTLLDVLDSEREYNSARVSYEAAQASRDYAVYELLSHMGKVADIFVEKEVVLAEPAEEVMQETTEAALEEVIEKADETAETDTGFSDTSLADNK